MLPSHFKRLLELLRSHLGAIEERLKEQERAVRDTSYDANETRREIPRIIARSIENSSDEQAQYEKTQRNKEYRQQFIILAATCWTAVFTGLAFGAAAYYASIAKDQLKQMAASNKATRCATLATSQSAAESAYYSREEERAWVEPWLPNAGSIQIFNPGKTVGRDVRVKLHTPAGEKDFGPLTISPYTYFPVPFKFPVNILPSQILRGDITYIDVFGVNHWSKFCYAFGDKGAMTPCHYGNEEDRELENPPKSVVPPNCRE